MPLTNNLTAVKAEECLYSSAFFLPISRFYQAVKIKTRSVFGSLCFFSSSVADTTERRVRISESKKPALRLVSLNMVPGLGLTPQAFEQRLCRWPAGRAC